MKRDIEKMNDVRDYIKRYYQLVSDTRMAIKFGVSVRSVAEARRKMGLKKSQEIIDGVEYRYKNTAKKNNKAVSY